MAVVRTGTDAYHLPGTVARQRTNGTTLPTRAQADPSKDRQTGMALASSRKVFSSGESKEVAAGPAANQRRIPTAYPKLHPRQIEARGARGCPEAIFSA